MARPDYCPVGNEPCQSMCDEPCSWQGSTRKDDTVLIQQLVEALEVTASDVCQVAHHKKRDQHGNGDACPVQARHDAAITAGRARLLEADLAKLTERGAVAWKRINPQDLRDGGKQ